MSRLKTAQKSLRTSCTLDDKLLKKVALADLRAEVTWLRALLYLAQARSEFSLLCSKASHLYKRRSLLGRQEAPLQSSCTYSAFNSMCKIVPRLQRQ